MNFYAITLRSDTGPVTYKINAGSIMGTLKTVLDIARAPESAVTSIRVLKKLRM